MVDAFLARRETLIPMLALQEEVLGHLLDRHPGEIGAFLDLGCGDGAMSELVLDRCPRARATLVDFSEPMLAGVAGRLGKHDERWQTRRGDLSDPGWRDGLQDGAYDAVVSGLAIHHLPPERKRGLFAEVFALLAPGGIFVNLDYVLVEGTLRGLFDEQMARNAAAAGHTHGEHGDVQDAARRLEEDGVGDEDIPDTAEDQLAWLREAGFEQAEVHFKWAEACVFGALKPKGGQQR
jgi:SAM-dependent methyltransferase